MSCVDRNQLREEAERYFEELRIHAADIDEAWNKCMQMVNIGLQRSEYGCFAELARYLEAGDGKYAFNHLGESRRLYRICNVICMEQRTSLAPFYEGCNTYDELLQKYMLVLYSLRRLYFELSDSSEDEAIEFLQKTNVSYIAIYIMLHDELIGYNEDLRSKIVLIYQDKWKQEDIQNFMNLMEGL